MVDRDRGWKQGYEDPLRREQIHFHSSATIAPLKKKKKKKKKENDIKNSLQRSFIDRSLAVVVINCSAWKY